MRTETPPAPPLLIVHSLPAWGGAGLAVMLAVLGTQGAALPSVLLSATADFDDVRRWPQPVVEQLEAAWAFHHRRGRTPDIFIGYLADAAQAQAVAEWLCARRARIGVVHVDPICGDEGRAYVPQTLVDAWLSVLAQADVAFPNLTEWTLLARAAGRDAGDAGWVGVASPATVIVTSCRQGEAWGNRLLQSGVDRFVPATRVDVRLRGTGDLFAACCLRARQFGLDWFEAVHLAARQTECAVRSSRRVGRGDALCLQPGPACEAAEL